MARLIYQTQNEQKKQLAAMLNSRKFKRERLVTALQEAKVKLRKRLKMSIALNSILLLYVIIRVIYG